MIISRRTFTIGAMLAAGTAGWPAFVKAQGAKTIAVLFDGLYSPFWVAGLDAIKRDLESRGFEMVQAISDQDDNRQFEQVISANHRLMMAIAPSAVQFAATNRRSAA